ncbi:contactin-associated protein-like 2 [Dendronephthya gigantea]|uniref:contactin-associated protein-like 2 n=1 Tax=Dendronephthya gigantea TaxID=151771 RepID=UPI00106BF1E0|nr:contactin-associated protein-like 2 [Dendronephthya gigantea]
MSVLLSINCALILVLITRILHLGKCQTVQVFFRINDGKYLANHVIETKHAETELECSILCVDHGSCVSVNYKTSGIGKGRCELNNKAIQDTSDVVKRSIDQNFKHIFIIKKIPPSRVSTSNPEISQNFSTGVLNDTNQSPSIYVETSCTNLRTKNPATVSGIYSIKPQGFNLLVRVFCNMTSKNGVGVTEIGHDSESRTLVDGYNRPGSYKRKIKYVISTEQIVVIMNQSKYCEQFIKYECHGSRLLKNSNGWWVSRQGSKMNYWGGAAVDSGNCSCGMTNSCAGGRKFKCNCDKNDETWREDSGYLTDKNTLPVTELRFGDTGDDPDSKGTELGYHTLVKLRCWG